MQVWIRGYHGFILEAVGQFVDEAELCFLFWVTNCIYIGNVTLHMRALHIWAMLHMRARFYLLIYSFVYLPIYFFLSLFI